MQNKRDFQARKDEYSAVGRWDVYRVEGYAKASGQARFTNDILLPDMLWAKYLRSPYAHARIVSLDTSKAEALPGVKAIIRYDDPEAAKIPLLDEAFYEGDRVGAVVCAESEEICDEALRLIDVQWEELPFTLSAEEALEPGFPKIHGGSAEDNLFSSAPINQRGDIEQGFAEADRIVEFDWVHPILCHSAAELWCSVADWEGNPESGHGEHITNYITTQYPKGMERISTSMVDLPDARGTCRSSYLGCSFGHKYGTRAKALEAVSLFSKKTGKPVKMSLSRSEDQAVITDSPGKVHFKVGFRNDGFITAIHIKNLVETGQGGSVCCKAGGVQGTPGLGGGSNRGGVWANFKCPNILNESIGAYTNTTIQAWYRGPDYPTVGLCVVTWMVADALDMDPAEVALKNVFEYEPGVGGVYSLDECIREAKERIDWDSKWHAPGAKQLPNGKMHGIGFRWAEEYDHGFYPPVEDPEKTYGSAFGIAVEVMTGGKVRLIGCLSDPGASTHTAYAMIAAEEIGAKMEDVTYLPHPNSSDVGFMPWPWGGSMGMVNTGPSCREAARKAKELLIKIGAPRLGVTPDECDTKDSTVYVKAEPKNSIPFASCTSFSHVTGGLVPVCYQDPVNNYQVTMTEVEVDPETGLVELTKAVVVNDVGTAIRPASVEGQMYGGYIFGIDSGLWAEAIYDEATGVRLNANYLDYKIATILDTPPIDAHIEEIGTGSGVYGSVGVGEDDFCRVNYPLAVYNAIGKWVQIPCTPDKVLKALGKI